MILTEREVDRVWEASGGRCPFGTRAVLRREDHVTRWVVVPLVPPNRGGTRALGNMAVVCRKHARMKGGLTVGEFSLKLLDFQDKICGI